MNMKILFVIETIDNKNGTSVSAMRFASELKKRGHEVKILTTGEPKADRFVVPERHLPLINPIVQRHGFQYGQADEHIIREALEWCDVAHCFMPFALEIATKRMAEKMGKPCTAAFHVQPENVTATFFMQNVRWVNSIIYSNFNKTFFKEFKRIHCPSNFIADYLQKHGYTSKMHVISNGCPSEYHWHKCDKPSWCNDKFVVLMVGRLSPEKHQEIILDAMQYSAYESQIQVILVGTGLSEQKLRKKAQKLTNPARIGYMAAQELMDVLGYADLYVHAGEVELESLSCLEAMSSGLVPLISDSPLSATPQFALDDRSLFKHGDPKALAKKIDYWIENPEIREKMGRTYANIAKRYSLTNSVKLFEKMLKEEIAEHETSSKNN